MLVGIKKDEKYLVNAIMTTIGHAHVGDTKKVSLDPADTLRLCKKSFGHVATAMA